MNAWQVPLEAKVAAEWLMRANKKPDVQSKRLAVVRIFVEHLIR